MTDDVEDINPIEKHGRAREQAEKIDHKGYHHQCVHRLEVLDSEPRHMAFERTSNELWAAEYAVEVVSNGAARAAAILFSYSNVIQIISQRYSIVPLYTIAYKWLRNDPYSA